MKLKRHVSLSWQSGAWQKKKVSNQRHRRRRSWEAASYAFILTVTLKWITDHDVSPSTVWVKPCRRFNLHKSALFQAWRNDESLQQVCLQLTASCLTGCCESPVLSSTVTLTCTTMHSPTWTTLTVTEASMRVFFRGTAKSWQRFRGWSAHTSRFLSDNLKPLQQYYQLSLGLRTEGHCYHDNQTSLFLLTHRRVFCLTVGTDMKIFLYVKCVFLFLFSYYVASLYEAKATIAHDMPMSWFSYQFLMQYATFGLFVNLPVLYKLKSLFGVTVALFNSA